MIVGVEQLSGRIVATRARDAPTAVALEAPSGLTEAPRRVKVSSTDVVAEFETGDVCWSVSGAGANFRRRLPNTEAMHEHGDTTVLLTEFDPMSAFLSDESGEGLRVKLPDGRLLLLSWTYDDFEARVEGSETSVRLDPGWHSRRSVEAHPVVDPTGTWLVVSMETTKHFDHGWLARWRLKDLLTATNGTRLDADELHPNGVPYHDEDRDWASYDSISAVAFSPDARHVFLLDTHSVQCWTWPGFEVVWRHPRPDQIPRLMRLQLPSPAVACSLLTARTTIRAALESHDVVDIDLESLEPRVIGSVDRPALAVSQSTGAVVLNDGSLWFEDRVLRAAVSLVSALADHTGAVFAMSREGVVFHSDGRNPLEALDGFTHPGGTLLAANTIGGVIVVRDGHELIFLAKDGQRLTEWHRWTAHALDPDLRSEEEITALQNALGDDWPKISTTAATVAADGAIFLGDDERVDAVGEYWFHTGGVVTAMASEANTLFIGRGDGSVSIRSKGQLFRVPVSERPIRGLAPSLAARRLTTLDDDGALTIITWG